jgi:hypothetical protein
LRSIVLKNQRAVLAAQQGDLHQPGSALRQFYEVFSSAQQLLFGRAKTRRPVGESGWAEQPLPYGNDFDSLWQTDATRRDFFSQ